MSVVPFRTLERVISFTRRKAVVKTEICTRPGVNKVTCRVTDPVPVTGLGNKTTPPVPTIGVRVGVTVSTGLLVSVAVDVSLWVKVGVIETVSEAVGVKVPVEEDVGVFVKVEVAVAVGVPV